MSFKRVVKMNSEVNSLIDGYHLFRKKYCNKNNRQYERLVKYGQKPKFLVIACSDSRVDPAILLNCEPGDLFVVRNVANLVPPYECDNGYHGTSAALEFGICELGIKNILILGHTQCGGITSMIESKKNNQSKYIFITKWMELANMACEAALSECNTLPREEQINECGRYAMIRSLNNLMTFPWIEERVLKDEIQIHLWNFDLKKGRLEIYRDKEEKFIVLE